MIGVSTKRPGKSRDASFFECDDLLCALCAKGLTPLLRTPQEQPVHQRPAVRSAAHGPASVRVVKLMFAMGTVQACSGGQPGSVVGLRQRAARAGTTCASETTPLRGSA